LQPASCRGTLLEGKKAQNEVDAQNKPIFKTDGFTVNNKGLWSARVPTTATGFSNKSVSLDTGALRTLAGLLQKKAAALNATWESHFGAGTFKAANTTGDVYMGTKRLALSAQTKKGLVTDNYQMVGDFILAQIDAATKEKMGS
jgi:hypothetical protein